MGFYEEMTKIIFQLSSNLHYFFFWYFQGPGCKFKDKSQRVFLNQNQLQDNLSTAWDIEDFVNVCKAKKVDCCMNSRKKIMKKWHQNFKNSKKLSQLF